MFSRIAKALKSNRGLETSTSSIFLGSGQAVWNDWTVEKSVNDGMASSVWVYRSVRLISKSTASVPLIVQDRDGVFLPDHPISKLLSQPNPQISAQDTMELLVSWLLLTGTAYLIKTPQGGRTVELWPASPDKIAPIPSKDVGKMIDGYTIERHGKKTHDPEEVVAFKFLDPSEPYSGIGPLQAAGKAVDIDIAQQNFQKLSMDNGLIAPGILNLPEMRSAKAIAGWAERLKEKYFGGGSSGAPIVVGGNKVEYTKLSSTPSEMDFKESRMSNRSEILAAFGINPTIMGALEASTYDNYSTAVFTFWDQGIIPILNDLADSLTFSFMVDGDLKEGEKVGFDLKGVAALNKSTQEKTLAARNLWTSSVPMEVVSNLLGLGMQPYEGWEDAFGGSKVGVPLVTPDEALEEDQKRSTAPSNTRLIKRGASAFRRELGAQEKAAVEYADDFAKELKSLENKVSSYGGNFRGIQSDIKSGKLFGDGDFAAMDNLLEEVYVDVGNKFAAAVVVNIRGEVEDAILDTLIEEQTVLNERTEIQATTIDKVLEQVAEGLDNSWSVSKLSEALTDTGVFSAERALRISRTTTTAAANSGQLVSAASIGATHKTWQISGANTRDRHVGRSGDTVEIDGTFSGGLRYPGDSNATAADRINCRCTMTYSII